MTIKEQVMRWVRMLARAGRIWLDADAFSLAGSLAFFTLFSIAPVIIVIVSIVGFFFGDEAAQGQIVVQLTETIGPKAAQAVQDAVARSQLDTSGIWATLAGVGAMLLGATTVFGQMQSALNAIWEVAPKPSRSGLFHLLRKRLGSLAIVISIGFVLLVSLSLGVALNAVLKFAQDWLPWQGVVVRLLESLVSLAVISSLFAVIFKSLPDARLQWCDVALGAVVTALLFTFGRYLIALYLAQTATASTYGAAASVVLLLMWVNYSSLILLFGAAFTRAHLEDRGLPIRPSAVAVRVHRQFAEEEAEDKL